MIEGCGRKPQKITSWKNYIFDVWLDGGENCTQEKRILRKIQISNQKSLYSLAEFIVRLFDFDFDHCFGFSDHLKDKRNRKKVFELFVDLEEASTSQARSVKKTRVSEAFDHVGERMIFLFDYGDGWQFHVDLKEISKAQKGDTKSVVLESIGEAPEQYPSCEEHES